MCGRRLGEEGGARGRKQLRQPRVWERLSPRGSGTEARLRGWGLRARQGAPLGVCTHAFRWAPGRQGAGVGPPAGYRVPAPLWDEAEGALGSGLSLCSEAMYLTKCKLFVFSSSTKTRWFLTSSDFLKVFRKSIG